MEPGHEDREYRPPHEQRTPHDNASMEPGHEDREYPPVPQCTTARVRGLNGARS